MGRGRRRRKNRLTNNFTNSTESKRARQRRLKEKGLVGIPTDVLKEIVAFYPSKQWFSLCRQLHSIAEQVIVPAPCKFLNYETIHGALCTVMKENNLVAAYWLLNNPQLGNVAANSSCTLRTAIECKLSQIALTLLQRPGIDPAACNNQPIEAAARQGLSRCIQGLLQFPQVDPSVNKNRPLQISIESSQENAVKFLLDDPRVDPSLDNNLALEIAIRWA
jgi:hypothetical protein